MFKYLPRVMWLTLIFNLFKVPTYLGSIETTPIEPVRPNFSINILSAALEM